MNAPDPLSRNDGPTAEKATSDSTPTRPLEEGTTLGADEQARAGGASSGSGSIGPYTLIRKLGEGGMGQVWLAEQTAPLRRRVAVKILRAGFYSDSLLQRFLAERQSLAIMNHPAIAKVFDAGATREGHPYFVMEYVPGVSITTYCNEKRLRISERLRLFIKVCEGVQHAHQKAIIHRDLKPANILIEEIDGQPMPRIIDFGIAKSLAAQAEGETTFTRAGFYVGTPGFMSPEQADSSLGDVDTRTDVYSLGVLLYVLLTDTLPFDPGKWNRQSITEAIRELREDDPQPPSRKISTHADSQKLLAETRNTPVPEIVTQVKGDLDWITMKALEKDRARRYGTPSEFAADVERYLENQPILARPATATYRFRKYVARHRVAVGVSAGFVVLLVAFAVGQALQLRRITRERDRADRVSQFMSNMFKVSDPSEARGNSITAREILDKSSAEIDKSLERDPDLRARMMFVMGTVYQNLGLYTQAHSLLEKALEIDRATFGPDSEQYIRTMTSLASLLLLQGQVKEAEKLAREASERSQRAFGLRNIETLQAMHNLQMILYAEGKHAEGEPLAREVLDTARSLLGPGNADTLVYIDGLAAEENALGRYPEAEKLFREGAELAERTLGPDHPRTINSMNNLAMSLSEAGHPDEAEKITRQVLETERRVLGPEHPETLSAASNLANYISDQGRYEEAAKLQREILEIQRRKFGPDHPEALRTADNLANSLSELKQYDEAEKLEKDNLERLRRTLGEHSPSVSSVTYNLACIYALQGNREEALFYLRQAMDLGLSVHSGLHIYDDEDLKSLRGDPRFEALAKKAHERAVAKPVAN
jgi:non-specific serine/threonine protein kinase/serine/threonine-protein kinase